MEHKEEKEDKVTFETIFRDLDMTSTELAAAQSVWDKADACFSSPDACLPSFVVASEKEKETYFRVGDAIDDAFIRTIEFFRLEFFRAIIRFWGKKIQFRLRTEVIADSLTDEEKARLKSILPISQEDVDVFCRINEQIQKAGKDNDTKK